MDKSQLDYLESLLIKEFREAGFELDNATAGNQSWMDKISKIHADNIWNIAQNVLEDIANIDLYAPITTEETETSTADNHYTIQLQNGQVISGKNPTQCYVNFFQYLLHDKAIADTVLSLVRTGEPSSRFLLGTTERFDKSGMRMTSPLAPNIHLFNNISTADKKRVLLRFADQINLPITINWD